MKFAVDVWKCLKFTGYAKLPFKWFDYLRETDSIAAPVKLFNKVMKLYVFVLELVFSLHFCIVHGMDSFVKYSFEKLKLLEIRTVWVNKGWYLWNVKQMQRSRKLRQWYLFFFYIKWIEIPVSALCLNYLDERLFTDVCFLCLPRKFQTMDFMLAWNWRQ